MAERLRSNMGTVNVFESKECQRVRNLLDHFLAGELAIETNEEILLHLGNCPRCRQEETLRRRAGQFLKASWDDQSVPLELENKIAGALERKQVVSFPVMRLAAAGLVGAIGLGTFLLLVPWLKEDSGLLLAVDHYKQALQDHLRCAGDLAPSALTLPLDPVERSIEQAFKEVDQAYELAETRICRVGEVSFVHYVFRNQESYVSLILEEKNASQRLRIPDHLSEKMVAGMRLVLFEQESVTIACLESPNYFVYLLNEEKEQGQTQQFVEKVVPRLKAVL